MRILQMITALILLIAELPCISYADPIVWEGNGIYEIRTGGEWFYIPELNTYDNVTVKMYEGGVNQFSMYDNSVFTMYGPGSVDYLNLYENATASFFGGQIMSELYIDPASMAQVKLFAHDITFLPLNPPFEPYSEGILNGRWLSNEMPFSINLVGQGAYSHIQFIPEPATLVLIGLGGLAAFRRRLR